MTLLAILPALLLMILSARERRDLDGRNVQQEALRLVVFAADNLQRDVHAARAFLGALTQDLRWRRGDPSQCAENLRKIPERTNLYSAVGVADSTGQVVCQSTGTFPYPSLARTAWFQEAMHTREFSVGYDGDHTLFQKVTMDFAQPILMPNGKRMVFFCALNLDWLNDLAKRVQLPENSTVTVLGSRNQVLVRYPDPDRWVGSRLDVDPLAASLSQGPRGVAEALGLDGVKRLYAFTEIPEGRLSLRLGIPSALAYAAADRAMRHNLLWLGAATLLALMATWLVGNWMMARPIEKLVAATRKLASGNLTARTDMDYSSGELGHLARAFDEMAESLEWREAQLRESEHERRHSEVRFTEMVELASDAIIGVDSNFSIFFFNRSAQGIFGYSADEMEGRDLRILDPGSDYPRNGHSELVNALRDPASQRVEVMVRAKDGTVFTADTSFTRANRNGQTSYTLILRERKTAETSEVAR